MGSGTKVGDEDEVEDETKDCEAMIMKKRAEGGDVNKNGGGTENVS
jgi:hypothetical protein